MLCREFKNILLNKTTYNYAISRPLIQSRAYSKWFDILSGNMASSVRLKTFRNIFLNRVFNAWTRNYKVNTVFKRCRTERGVKDMFYYFRQVFFRPRTHLLVSATATFKNTEEKPGPPKRCSRNIKDKDMKRLIKDLSRVEDLSKATLYCEGCDKRIVIDSKHKGVQYCECPNSKPTVGSFDGWVPYMEADHIIIWRKEYKPGGLYAYKVYGRYKHLKAEDFAMIQVDGAYRKQWDSSVASMSVVEREANGFKDQCVLHWEVLWPRLFSNRDYVYLRRHQEFKVKTKCYAHKDGLFPDKERCKPTQPLTSVHAHAKQKSLEMEANEGGEEKDEGKENKVYVIVSRSCVHPDVPESSNAVRVMEYWSHMVVTTLNGPDQPGMEFVLTYYDEPSVGGLPTAITSWAMGRAGPAFLERMRQAAEEYTTWRKGHTSDAPEFELYQPKPVSFDTLEDASPENDMGSTKEGPEIDCSGTRDESTQTKPVLITPFDDGPKDGPQVSLKEETSKLKHILIINPTTPVQSQKEHEETLQSQKEHNEALELPLKDHSSRSPSEDLQEDKLELQDVSQKEEQLLEENQIKQPEKVLLTLDIQENAEKIVSTDTLTESSIEQRSEKLKSIENISETPKLDKFTATIESKSDESERDSYSVADETDKDDDTEGRSWWRYLYPLYYFV